MDATQEEWRAVLGYEGQYEVSNRGQVRSLDRIITFPDGRYRRARGRILKPWTLKRIGHQCVGLAGKSRALVHVLVLEAFVGPRPDGLVACHNNGIADDNRVENLRWDTYAENNKDLVRHGTHWQTQKTHCPRGHEYDVKNTRVYQYKGSTLRYCRACAVINSRAAKARMKAQRHARGLKKSGPPLKTHCIHGHEFTPENTYIRPDGRGRQCLRCIALQQQRRLA